MKCYIDKEIITEVCASRTNYSDLAACAVTLKFMLDDKFIDADGFVAGCVAVCGQLAKVYLDKE